MGLIQIEGMEFYAFHGCYEEEQIVGNRFLVDISMEADTAKSGISDNIDDTVNYQRVYEAIKSEMTIKSKLLEHVAQRILEKVSSEFPQIKKIELKISKINPPMGGQIKCVSVTLKK